MEYGKPEMNNNKKPWRWLDSDPFRQNSTPTTIEMVYDPNLHMEVARLSPVDISASCKVRPCFIIK